jgi:hypothetical protein
MGPGRDFSIFHREQKFLEFLDIFHRISMGIQWRSHIEVIFDRLGVTVVSIAVSPFQWI